MPSNKIDNSAYGTKKTIDHVSTIRKRGNQLYPSEKKFFLKAINNASTFLDLGCATGNFIKIIRSKTKIKDYLGIDVSKNMIERAKLEYPGYKFLHYDGKFLRVKKKFDLSFCFGTLEYCNNYESLIKQMLNLTNKFLIFDLRLTFESTLINKKKSYQIIPRSDGRRLSYNIINFYHCIKFLFNITKFNYSLNLFGYEHKPSKSVTTKYKNVIMTSVLIDKTRKFELKIDLK